MCGVFTKLLKNIREKEIGALVSNLRSQSSFLKNLVLIQHCVIFVILSFITC